MSHRTLAFDDAHHDMLFTESLKRVNWLQKRDEKQFSPILSSAPQGIKGKRVVTY
jgi:hypothetical protein